MDPARSGAVTARVSERNERARQTKPGAIKETAHAACLRALHVDESQLAADVVAALETGKLGLIESHVALQAGDAFFDGVSKPGTDLETFIQSKVLHGELQVQGEFCGSGANFLKFCSSFLKLCR
jgi:hypothetical protein